jgi:hypothetical protein
MPGLKLCGAGGQANRKAVFGQKPGSRRRITRIDQQVYVPAHLQHWRSVGEGADAKALDEEQGQPGALEGLLQLAALPGDT